MLLRDLAVTHTDNPTNLPSVPSYDMLAGELRLLLATGNISKLQPHILLLHSFFLVFFITHSSVAISRI